MNRWAMGIDIGGTKVRMGTVEEDGTMRKFRIYSSKELAKGTDSVCALEELIRTFLEEEEAGELPSAIGIGAPSKISKDRQVILSTPNLQREDHTHLFEQTNVVGPLQAHFGIPVVLNKDVENLLYQDMWENHCKVDRVTAMGIYVGTGFGAAVFQQGTLLTGRNGLAMDVGHMPFFHGKRECGCGKIGCAEAYASGRALVEIMGRKYPQDPIDTAFAEHGKDEEIREVVEAMGVAVGILLSVFDPDVVFLGGGIMNMKGFPWEDFQGEVTKHLEKSMIRVGLPFLQSQPGEEKGVLGAVRYVMDYKEARERGFH